MPRTAQTPTEPLVVTSSARGFLFHAHRSTCKKIVPARVVADTLGTPVEPASCCKPKMTAAERLPRVAQAAGTRSERVTLAKQEHLAVKAWTKAGEIGPRPSAPNLDYLATHKDEPKRRGVRTNRSAVTSETRTASGKAAPGAFLLRVLQWLEANPEGVYSPSDIDKALENHNSGAVGNALERLVKQGRVLKAQDKPRRYAFHVDAIQRAS